MLAQALVGEDPQQQRRELRATPTLNEFVRDRYLPHVKSYKRSWCTDETVLRLHILPELGPEPVDQVKNEAISDLLTAMRDKGYASGTTNRVLILLRYIYNLGRKWRVAGMTQNPTLGLSTAPDVQRDRFLSPEETQRLIAAIEQDENQTAARAILLLLLTGGRRNEITQAKWEYVNWERRTLLVPLSKSGKPRAIALNGPALALLRAIPRTDNPYIFPSPVNGKPSASLFFPWDRIRKRAGPEGRAAARSAAFLRELPRQPGNLALRRAGPARPRAFAHHAALRASRARNPAGRRRVGRRRRRQWKCPSAGRFRAGQIRLGSRRSGRHLGYP